MTRLVPATDATIADAAAAPAGGRARGVPDRDRLRARRRRDARTRRWRGSTPRRAGRASIPLIAHVASLGGGACSRVDFAAAARALAEAFWPGPLTLVVPAAATCTRQPAGARRVSTAWPCACPVHPVARALLAACGATRRRALGQPLRADQPDRRRPRRGRTRRPDRHDPRRRSLRGRGWNRRSCRALAADRAAASGRRRARGHRGRARTLARCAIEPDAARPVAPGMLSSHYAPRAPRAPRSGRCRGAARPCSISPGSSRPWRSAPLYLDLSPAGDLGEAAANLFAFLRGSTRRRVTGIAVAPVPADGLGAADQRSPGTRRRATG